MTFSTGFSSSNGAGGAALMVKPDDTRPVHHKMIECGDSGGPEQSSAGWNHNAALCFRIRPKPTSPELTVLALPMTSTDGRAGVTLMWS